ncbi:hypothetical protein OG413_20555 [Streptomyces sp. NBC_01433]|uniref:hypothetical protein n=1 Tax=Streptomyces sp. NBC_01433 TaxID=2903864 RepID=UPI002250442D|nr:hypothetical protein [Streptomyces sp. NBC_01433]MCX4677666.1 hypothetical protein [Streptomyces sp. NBC_01433]
MNTTTAHNPTPGATETTIDLTGVTPYTVGIIRLAEAKGLHPTWQQPYGNSRRIVLNAVGPHATFGSITIGRTSGKVLRAEVIHGNGAKPRRAKGTNAVRELLNGVQRTNCSLNCADPSSCRP